MMKDIFETEEVNQTFHVVINTKARSLGELEDKEMAMIEGYIHRLLSMETELGERYHVIGLYAKTLKVERLKSLFQPSTVRVAVEVRYYNMKLVKPLEG